MESSHILTLALTVSSNRVMSWSITLTDPVNTSRSISPMGTPSKVMEPLQGWFSPLISLASVDFPQPVRPTKATFSPGLMFMEKSVISGFPSLE